MMKKLGNFRLMLIFRFILKFLPLKKVLTFGGSPLKLIRRLNFIVVMGAFIVRVLILRTRGLTSVFFGWWRFNSGMNRNILRKRIRKVLISIGVGLKVVRRLVRWRMVTFFIKLRLFMVLFLTNRVVRRVNFRVMRLTFMRRLMVVKIKSKSYSMGLTRRGRGRFWRITFLMRFQVVTLPSRRLTLIVKPVIWFVLRRVIRMILISLKTLPFMINRWSRTVIRRIVRLRRLWILLMFLRFLSLLVLLKWRKILVRRTRSTLIRTRLRTGRILV